MFLRRPSIPELPMSLQFSQVPPPVEPVRCRAYAFGAEDGPSPFAHG